MGALGGEEQTKTRKGVVLKCDGEVKMPCCCSCWKVQKSNTRAGDQTPGHSRSCATQLWQDAGPQSRGRWRTPRAPSPPPEHRAKAAGMLGAQIHSFPAGECSEPGLWLTWPPGKPRTVSWAVEAPRAHRRATCTAAPRGRAPRVSGERSRLQALLPRAHGVGDAEPRV